MKKDRFICGQLIMLLLLFPSAFLHAQVHVQRDTTNVEVIKNTASRLQKDSCPDENFNRGVGNWKRSNYWPGHHDNKVYIPTNSTTGASGVEGLDYALDGFDLPGHDILFNQIDYKGNLRKRGDYFCYDFRVITYAGKTAAKPEIVFYRGDMTTSRRKKDQYATFVIDVSIDTLDGWTHICIPIFEAAGNRLPQNKMGHWEVKGNRPVRNFDKIMTHTDGVYFLLDLNTNPNEKYAFDNICIHNQTAAEPSPRPKISCCRKGEDLLKNGTFEEGNKGFQSDYKQDSATLPGQFNVSHTSEAFGLAVKDHTYCTDSSFVHNKQFLLVNGLTNQPENSSAVVFSQTVELKKHRQYKICAALKNLPQSTFDILPEIQIEANGNIVIPYTRIDAKAEDPCDWVLLSGCFNTGGEKNTTISFRLKEDGLGDGNDLALDDISLKELAAPFYNLTVPHNGGKEGITVTINPYPLLNKDCDSSAHYWFIYETDDSTGSSTPSVKRGTFAWSDESGSYGPGLKQAGPAWNVPTTNFPNYDFQANKTYVIGGYVPGCCESCFTGGWVYRMIATYPSGMQTFRLKMNEELKKKIQALFVK